MERKIFNIAKLLTSVSLFCASSSAQSLGGNGVNVQASYYNNGNVNFGYSLMKRFSAIKTVRIEIEPTIPIWLATSWIRQATKNGYAVVASYHKHTIWSTNRTNSQGWFFC